MSFAGKTVVVTGGSSGIGLAIAKTFAAEGAKVVITGRQMSRLDAAAKKIGDNAVAIQGDASNIAQLNTVFGAIKSQFGKIDILVANAGSGTMANIGAISEAHFDETFNPNVKGVLFTVQNALPLMGPGGSIVLIGSTSSTDMPAGMSVYGATKAALRAMVRAWIQEIKGSGIRINVVSPGPIMTPGLEGFLTPEAINYLEGRSTVGRLGRPEDIAHAVAFLASDASSYINGIELFSDGGASQV